MQVEVCVCESVAVWCGKCGIVGVWKSGRVRVWECGSGVYLNGLFKEV